jgi:hypothetical protein
LLSDAVPAGRGAGGFVFVDFESVVAFNPGSFLGDDPGTATDDDVDGGGLSFGGFTDRSSDFMSSR